MARAETAYRLSAAAPLFVVSLPISHTVDTEAARSRERLRDTAAFFAPGVVGDRAPWGSATASTGS